MLLKNPRKRKHPGFEEEKDEIGLQSVKNSNQEKDKTILQLKKLIDKFESEKLGFIEDQEKLEMLYRMEIIDNKGNSLLLDPPFEDDMK